MNNEKLVQNGEVEELQNDKNDTGRALLGKIARLPADIRDEVSLRLYNGRTYPDILAWLNELPPVKEILAARFDAAPVNTQNLSNWRATGFLRWLKPNKIMWTA